MRDIAVIVKIIGQGEFVQVGQLRRDDLLRWRFTAQQGGTELRKLKVGFARNDIVCLRTDNLLVRFKTHFGSAQNDGNVWPDALEHADDFAAQLRIPNVDSHSDNFRLPSQDDFHDIRGALLDIELQEAGARAQRAEVGQKVAQAKRGVNVFGVECGQDNVGHNRNQIRAYLANALHPQPEQGCD